MKPFIVLAFTCLIFSSSCTRLNNQIHRFEQQCGEAPQFENFQYFRVLNPEGNLVPGADLRVQTPGSSLTSKNCLKVPHSNPNLEISYPKRSAGISIALNPKPSDSLNDVKLVAFAYKNVVSKCPASLATQGPILEPQVDLKEQDLRGYSWAIELADEKKVHLKTSSESQTSSLQTLSLLDVRPLPDGRYSLTMKFKQLHSVDQLESSMDCQIFIDRKSPVFSLSGLQRVDGNDTSVSIIAPGESIRLLVDDQGTPVKIFACLAKVDGGIPEVCDFQQLDDRILIAPATGEWILRGYAVDAAENKGPLTERKFQIVDGNAISVVKTLSQQAEFAVSTGQGMTSMLSAVQSYEKFKSLGSDEEKSAVKDDVRKALFETSVLPREELYFPYLRPEQRGVVGLTETPRGLALASLISNDLTGEVNLSLAPVNGDLEFKISLNQLGRFFPSVSSCGSKKTLALFGTAGMVLIVNGVAKPFVEFKEKSYRSVSGLSVDCRYAYFRDLEASQYVIKIFDTITDQVYTVGAGALTQVYQAVGRSSILVRQSSGFAIVDLLNGESRPAITELPNSKIRSVLSTQSGEIGILTNDNILHIFSLELLKVAEFNSVEAIYAASTPKEIIAVDVGSSAIRIINAELGSVAFQISSSFEKLAYVGVDRNHLVFRSNTVDRVRIFSRNGYQPEDIYSLDSHLSGVWIADPGFLFLQNERSAKLFQLDSDGVFLKKRPPFASAAGMDFVGNDQLIFKSQATRKDSNSNYVLEGSFSIWDATLETFASKNLPSTADVAQVPAYAKYSRDVKVFNDTNGQAMLATVFGKGNVGIFYARSPETLKVQRNICKDWAHDLDIAPNGSIGAMACADKTVIIFDLETLEKLSSHTMIDGQPMNVGFDATSRHVFVTDVYQGLHKLTYTASTKTLEPGPFLENAGVRLAMAPKRDSLAVLSSDAQVRIYDLNLGLLQAPISTNSQFSVTAISIVYNPVASKIYASMYDGAVTEIDLKTARSVRIRYNQREDSALSLKVSPNGEKLAFYGKGQVQIWELDEEKRYLSICRWLKPRLRYFAGLPGYSTDLCKGTL